MKGRHLVAYDYGQGAVWGFVIAETPGQIAARYPRLTIVDSVPGWMDSDRLSRLERDKTFDIGDRDGLWRAGLIGDDD